jgi:thiol-disulfide isomerase/thioredoxin
MGQSKRAVAIGVGLVVLIAAIAAIMLSRGGAAGSASNLSKGEFPDDWFAPALPDELPGQYALIGKPMPPLDLSDWKNAELKPEDLKGKVILIDFWGTFCAPCIAAFPENNALYAKYKSQGVEFLGICTNEGQENYAKVIATKKPEYPMARDADLKTMKAWAALSYPNYALVDRKGIVRAMGLKHEFIEQAIEKLAGETASAK